MLDHDTPVPVRYLFLSHNSADKPSVEKFIKLVEMHPLAREHNLQVWLDKSDLNNDAGFPRQLIEAIRIHSCAFALYLTNNPITAWIEEEISHAHKRHVDDHRAGKYYPLIPFYAHARASSVVLPLELDIQNARENVFGDLDQVEHIINQALGLHRSFTHSSVGTSPASDTATNTTPSRKKSYDLWLSFVLKLRDNYIHAEDDEGNIRTLAITELPNSYTSHEQLRPISQLLLGNKWHLEQMDKQKLRLRIMTDDPVLAMLPWDHLPHPKTGKLLLDDGWIIETSPVLGRSYRTGFVKIAPHTPLIAIPAHHKHEIVGNNHYSQIQNYLEAYLDIHNTIPRVTTPQALQRELCFQQPDLLYIYAHFDGEYLKLDSGSNGEDSVSLQTLGEWITEADIQPVVILGLIGNTPKNYPQTLVKASQLVWIQATSRFKKLGDLGKNLEQVLSHTSRNGDLVSLIIEYSKHCHLGMQNLLWLNGQTPWLDTTNTLQKRSQQLRAALLKVMLGRGALKDRMAGGIYRHLNQRIPLTSYAVTGDAKACPHDVPEQIKHRLQWDDPERSLPVVQFYFHIMIEPGDDIKDLLDRVISQGILHGNEDVGYILNFELDRRGLQRQECCIALNWLFRVSAVLEAEISELLEIWGAVVCEYFSKIKLDRAILINAICLEVQNEHTAQTVQDNANKKLRSLRNHGMCSMQPLVNDDALSKLKPGEISDFFESNQRYWFNELKLEQYNIDSYDYAGWIVKKTDGLFEDTVNLVWREYRHDYQDYLNA